MRCRLGVTPATTTTRSCPPFLTWLSACAPAYY